MFINSSKILFLSILMMSTMITISANSWLSAWMGLEINLLSFIPLMKDDTLMSAEASMKYFLVQTIASAVLLLGILILSMKNSFMNFNYLNMNFLMLTTLLMKSGAAPFHFWFPNVIQNMSWSNSLILMTWQKIAPLFLISNLIMNMNFMMQASICLSATFGAIGGLNQTSLQKLMAYSSINHLGWMLSALYINKNMMMNYFLLYSFMTSILILLFMIFKIYYINQLFSLFFKSKTLKLLILINLLSLGGLPPLIGFFPKWMIIQGIIDMQQLLILSILVMSSLITLYFYLRIAYAAFILNYSEPAWSTKMWMSTQLMNFIMICSFYSFSGMILITMYFFML